MIRFGDASTHSEKMVRLALIGACAMGCGVVAAGVTAGQAEALTDTYLTMKQFDGKHVVYLGQSQRTGMGVSTDGQVATNIKVSNKKVATTPYPESGQLYVDFHKTGTTKITYKVKGKMHTSTWTVKKYSNPFATLKSGTKDLKKYTGKGYFDGSITGYGAAPIYIGVQKDIMYQNGTAEGQSISGLKSGQKLVVKPAKGWKVYSLNIAGNEIKSGSVVPKGTGTVSVVMQNKKDKTIVSYNISDNSMWG